jgi:NAD(P)-dependent dehydrogenase (short-subunit alcohol dehydrogenase family)
MTLETMSSPETQIRTGNSAFSLKGRKAVVTGGGGLIGAAIVRAMADSGASVTVLDKADDDVRALFKNSDPPINVANCDVTDFDVLADMVNGIDEDLGGIDIWVNSAYPRTEDWGAKPADTPMESWRRNVDIQMNSSCLLADYVARRMATRKSGSIINVASIFGVVAPDFQVYEGTDMTTPAAYTAIKGGVIAHTRFLASYYGRSGVRVNAICPGGVRGSNQPDSFVDAYGKRTALGRMANADEIGPPVVFLASDAASYVTGSALMVDGGWTAI